MAKKGDRKTNKEDIIKIINEELIVSTWRIADILNIHYDTAERILSDMVEEGHLVMVKHQTKKRIIRRFKLSMRTDGTDMTGKNEPNTPRTV